MTNHLAFCIWGVGGLFGLFLEFFIYAFASLFNIK